MFRKLSLSLFFSLAVAFGICAGFLIGGSISAPDIAQAQPVRRVEIFTETHDYGNLVDAAGESNTVAIAGAALGDACVASVGVSTVGMTMTCNITAADTAIVRLQNESGGAVDLASTTQRVYLFRED